MTPSEVKFFDLTDDERLLLLSGLMEYGGPAYGAPVVAPIVGAASKDDFSRLTDRLYAAIEDGQALSDLDWARALVLVEICWASDLLGAASDFGTNMSDERALTALRSLQRKIVTGERIQLLIGSALSPGAN
jgi:hypothetical protein